jgi:tetratricopeptide (TPR) repeat protein
MSRPELSLADGIALHRQGRLVEAERVYQDVLRQTPDDFDALHFLGVIALQTGRLDAGIELIAQSIALNPTNAAAHNNLGNGLLALNRHAEAVASYDKAIAQRTGFAETYYSRGNALMALHQPQAAVASYDAAIARKPDHANAYHRRGAALHELSRPEAAVESFDKAIALQPDHADAYYHRGNAFRALHRHAEALVSFDRAIALQPDYADAYCNRGNALRDLSRPEEAIASYDRAAELRPDFAAAYSNRGLALQELNRHEAAIESYDKAIALQPDFAGAWWNQSLCRLAMGDFQRGWEMHEWRWKAWLADQQPELPGPPWLGQSPIEGKTILVVAEQGLGDSLQFCRYVPLLAARATVVLLVPRALVRLLAGLQGVARIVALGDPLPAFDAWTPMLSLPLAFRTTLASIPSSMPYLSADPQRSAVWRQRLAAFPGLKVGLVWAGSPRHDQPALRATDLRRSITLQHYAPLAAISGLCLVSLQKGEAAAQTPPPGMVLHDRTAELNDFADTAALVDALDLVISVDTSVVHLAGALGRPVWILNRYDQCWRWLRDRTDSPWYPSARLFRQPTPGDWPSTIDAVARALREKMVA